MVDEFKDKAKNWDDNPWKQKLAQETFDEICSKVEIHSGDRLIDLGGGTGLLALKFKDKVSGLTIIDTSHAMLDVLRNKIRSLKLTNVEIIDEVLTPGMLTQNSQNLIISMMTLHHVSDLFNLFQIFYNILDSNGKIALVDLAKEDGDFHPEGTEYVHNGFDKETLKVPLVKAGFKDIEINEFTSIKGGPISGNTKEYPVLLLTASKSSIS